MTLNLRKVEMIRIFLLSILLLTSGCSDQLKDYVRSRPWELPETSIPGSDMPTQRISSGAGVAAGSQVTTQFTLTTSQRQISGQQVRSTISFSQR